MSTLCTPRKRSLTTVQTRVGPDGSVSPPGNTSRHLDSLTSNHTVLIPIRCHHRPTWHPLCSCPGLPALTGLTACPVCGPYNTINRTPRFQRGVVLLTTGFLVSGNNLFDSEVLAWLGASRDPAPFASRRVTSGAAVHLSRLHAQHNLSEGGASLLPLKTTFRRVVTTSFSVTLASPPPQL